MLGRGRSRRLLVTASMAAASLAVASTFVGSPAAFGYVSWGSVQAENVDAVVPQADTTCTPDLSCWTSSPSVFNYAYDRAADPQSLWFNSVRLVSGKLVFSAYVSDPATVAVRVFARAAWATSVTPPILHVSVDGADWGTVAVSQSAGSLGSDTYLGYAYRTSFVTYDFERPGAYLARGVHEVSVQIANPDVRRYLLIDKFKHVQTKLGSVT